jgi:hypothetical protein
VNLLKVKSWFVIHTPFLKKKPAQNGAGFATCSPVTCLGHTQAWQPFPVTGSSLPLLEATFYSFVKRHKPILLVSAGIGLNSIMNGFTTDNHPLYYRRREKN